MVVSLADHFAEQRDEGSHDFVRSEIRATSSRDHVVGALALLLNRNKANPSVTAELLERLDWHVAFAPLQSGNLSVRRGDFGEMLAAEAAEAFDGSIVPVRKLRYQIDPSQTLPGSDVVALIVDHNDNIVNLDFIESKYRGNPPSGLAVDAYYQILDDRAERYVTTLNFIAHRLSELDSSLYASFLRFLEDRDIAETYTTVSLSFDKRNWKESIATQLDDVTDLIPDVQLRLFFLTRATELVDDVYSRMLELDSET